LCPTASHPLYFVFGSRRSPRPPHFPSRRSSDLALRAYGKEFTASTGANVEFDFSPWETLMPKVQADLASGQPQFDLFMNDIEFQDRKSTRLNSSHQIISYAGFCFKKRINIHCAL